MSARAGGRTTRAANFHRRPPCRRLRRPLRPGLCGQARRPAGGSGRAMIRFALVCDNGHEFESWFASNESYDFQIDNSLVSCPHCNGPEDQQGGDGPGGRAARTARPQRGAQAECRLARRRRPRNCARWRMTFTPRSSPPRSMSAPISRSEARRIHDGEAPERPIRGQASPEEAARCSKRASPSCPCRSCPKTAAETAVLVEFACVSL